MAVKLRLMRMGKKKQPTYRVVAADSRSPRNGRFIEIIGTYEPRQDPSVIKIDNERAVHWLANGAQPTDRVEKLLKISGAWTEHTGEAFDATVSFVDALAELGLEWTEYLNTARALRQVRSGSGMVREVVRGRSAKVCGQAPRAAIMSHALSTLSLASA